MLFALKVIVYLVYVVLHRARTFAEVSFKVMHSSRSTVQSTLAQNVKHRRRPSPGALSARRRPTAVKLRPSRLLQGPEDQTASVSTRIRDRALCTRATATLRSAPSGSGSGSGCVSVCVGTRALVDPTAVADKVAKSTLRQSGCRVGLGTDQGTYGAGKLSRVVAARVSSGPAGSKRT